MFAALRRKRFEARLLALELAQMFGDAMGQARGQQTAVAFPKSFKKPAKQKVHADQLFREMGITIK